MKGFIVLRLDKLLADRGFGSRKEVAALARAGHVLVNGQCAQNAAEKIDLARDCVTVRGVLLDLREHSYIMLHKPPGVISASRDPKVKTVLDLVPPQLWRRGLFPVGRLDKDSTGLLLITNDGALAHTLLSPRRHVAKTYLACLKAPATQSDVEAFTAGLRLSSGEVCLPAQLGILEDNRARVVLHEGKYHQVKRMFAARGNEVLALHRVSMGPLALDERLVPGQCRPLNEAEEKDLKKVEANRTAAPLI